MIAGGNKTALVWECPHSEQHTYAKSLLHHVEQVGFVYEGASPKLTMMGGELCVDGMLALASVSRAATEALTASGVRGPVTYRQVKGETEITFDLPYTTEENIVLFEGIGFMCVEKEQMLTKQKFQHYIQKYKVPAFGIIVYTGEQISPWVYVAETDSLIQETACGSGSIALHLIHGISRVVQPTRESIVVTHTGNTFTVSASVQPY